MGQRSFAAALAVAVLVGVGAIALANNIDVPGVSKVVRPAEAGVGTRCAMGDEPACAKLCEALSDVSTIRCVDQLAQVFPRVHDGERIAEGGIPQSGAPPGQQLGGEAPAASPPPQTDSPPDSPPATTTTTTPVPGNGGVVDRICRIDPLLGRVCELVP